MASEGVLRLDCTIRQQLSCSVPQDGKASRGNQESLGGKRQCQFCLKDVIIASLHARARHNLLSHRLVSRTGLDHGLIATCSFELCTSYAFRSIGNRQALSKADARACTAAANSFISGSSTVGITSRPLTPPRGSMTGVLQQSDLLGRRISIQTSRSTDLGRRRPCFRPVFAGTCAL